MIDLHSHILPGLDDGARSEEDALEIARAAVADGIRTIAATPHVRADYPTEPDGMEAALARLQAVLAEHDVPLEVVAGGELDLTQLSLLDEEAVRRFSFGGAGRAALLEFPYEGWPRALEPTTAWLLRRGIVPLLAHPERNAQVQQRPERLRELVDAGCLVQVTAGAVDGRLGRRAEAAARALVGRRLVHVLASDAHSASVRAVGMRAAAEALGDAQLARYLTVEAPAALLAGEPVPPPPEPARAGRVRFWRKQQ